MRPEDVRFLSDSCRAVSALAELVIAGPKPPPAPPSVPMEAIHARFSPSESQLLDKLTMLAADLKRRGELIGEVIEWDGYLPDATAAETRGWVSSAAQAAGEMLRCRERAAQSPERAGLENCTAAECAATFC